MGGNASWECIPLEDCTTDGAISYGIVQPGQHVDDGIPIVRVNNFQNDHLDLSSVLRVSPDVEKKYARTRLEGGEVLLTLVGSTGQSVVVPKEMAGWNVPRAIAVIRVKEEIGAEWINICLQSQATKDYLDARANTTVQKTLNLKDVRSIPIPLPSKRTKNFIVSVIGSLERKIRLNKQMNETLEAMAQALFKSWFVDFDPVIDNALKAGKPIPEDLEPKAAARKALGKDRKARPEDIQKLFPDEFVCSEEMGWVPLGWGVKQLGEVISIKHGYAFKGEHFSLEPTSDVLVTPGNFHIGGGFKNDKLKFYSGQVPKGYVLAPNDLVVTMTDLSKQSDTLGYPALVPDTQGTRYLHNQRIGKVEFLDGSLKREHLYQVFCSAEYRDEVLASATGTTVKHTSPKKILCHTAIIASPKIEEYFENNCSAFRSRISKNAEQICQLSELRDSLLPKLLSGEVEP